MLDRVVGDTTRGVSTTPAETVYVRSFYNIEGQPDSVQRWAAPDYEAIGKLTNRWRYDLAGRVVADIPPDILTITPDTLADSTVYDPAGNATKLISRRFRSGPFVTLEYDELNRLKRRTIPGVSVPEPPWTIVAQPPEVFGLRSYPYVIPADVQDFTYAADGALVTANNRYSKITRVYDTLRRLKSETQQVATVEETFSGHQYILNYAYDRNGRLVSLEVPSIFAIGSRDTINYSYHPRIDELASVKGVASESFVYTYNRRREDSVLAYPGGYTRFGLWDSDGNRVSDSIWNSSAAAPRWPYPYVRRTNNRLFDGRGKLWRSPDLSFFGDSTAATFTGLGLVLSAKFRQKGKDQTHSDVEYGSQETFTTDPLGNLSVSTRRDSLKVNGGWQTTHSLNNSYVYQAKTGRLLSLTATTYTYDLAGNVAFESQLLTNGKRERAVNYGVDGTLRAIDQKTVFVGPGKPRAATSNSPTCGRVKLLHPLGRLAALPPAAPLQSLSSAAARLS